MGFETTGIFGLLILVADIYAIVKILQSSADTARKVIWIIIVLLLPLLGVILWWFMGPKGE